MCETSNSPAAVRTALCSSMTPAYWTGMSQPGERDDPGLVGDVPVVERGAAVTDMTGGPGKKRGAAPPRGTAPVPLLWRLPGPNCPCRPATTHAAMLVIAHPLRVS